MTVTDCSYVEEVLVSEEELDKKLQGQFVTQQLCSMLAVFDLSDEVGRLVTCCCCCCCLPPQSSLFM